MVQGHEYMAVRSRARAPKSTRPSSLIRCKIESLGVHEAMSA